MNYIFTKKIEKKEIVEKIYIAMETRSQDEQFHTEKQIVFFRGLSSGPVKDAAIGVRKNMRSTEANTFPGENCICQAISAAGNFFA